MTLDLATLVKCHRAMPALGEVHRFLTGGYPRLDDAISKEAAAALWSYPELLAAAVELHELKKVRPAYHTLEVKERPR